MVTLAGKKRDLAPSRKGAKMIAEKSEEVKQLEAAVVGQRMTIERQAARIKELEDIAFKLKCQSDSYFETKETLRHAFASMSNPFR